ncbi:uncharacterized protein DS421_5g135690 [Arachis hypogaea]|nr:uncharacterized protein DS421_5g135690 [Arachis hypogaea]
MMNNNSTIPSCNFESDACVINQKSPIGKGENIANSEEELVNTGQMDFDLYSSDNDEESSEMSLGVCGSSGSFDDDDSTSLFGIGTSHSESNKESHRSQGDVHGKVPVLLTAKDFLHTVFTSEEEAYNAYKEFAWTRGFGVRKGDVGRVDGVLVRCVSNIQSVALGNLALSESSQEQTAKHTTPAK